jgi:hypothetical protein
MKWEYITEHIESRVDDYVKFDETLNRFGDDAWELVSSTYTVHPGHSLPGMEEEEPTHSFVYVFKRPKSEAFEQLTA